MQKKTASRTFICLLLAQFAAHVAGSQETLLPDARGRGHLVYHPKSKALLLIDGYTVHLDSTQNNVWKWDGNKWDRIAAYGPGSRCGNAVAVNSKTGDIYSFGGWGKGGFANDGKNDVWRFDGARWHLVKTNFIAKHDHHKMVYADHLDAIVIYGGRDATTDLFDSTTWLLKDGTFLPLNISGPGPRGNAGVAYDPLRKKLVLFGGKRYDTPADLWEFDGAKWEQVPVPDIGLTTGQEATYSEDLRMVVVHGHTGTWGWDGKNTKKIADGGPAEANIALGYDKHRKLIVAYGGFSGNKASSALWELKDGVWRKVSDNGTWQYIDGKYTKATQ